MSTAWAAGSKRVKDAFKVTIGAEEIYDEGPLYEVAKKVYPQRVWGTYRRLKWIVLWVALGVYYILPFIRWDRGPNLPDQAVMADIAHSRFYFFFIQIWPQEVYYFTGLLILAALILFLSNALFGRVWCGYACPQTVWTDLYFWVERQIEGDRRARMKLDGEPWTADKIVKRGAKHAIWLLIALATGGAAMLYFVDAPTLMREFFTLRAPAIAYIWAGILTFTTYALAGGMREQVCTYMCPWPRIQGAMIDNQSLQVTYRADRGETRGPHKKGDSWEGRGDCIDCNQCVVVCPMGIDIRDGAQLECINCGLCIDACNEVMVKVGRPRGLIAYDTDAAVAARSCGQKPRYQPVRPRTIYYAAALAVVGAVMLAGLLTRPTVGLDVIRDRSPTFVRLASGDIRNGYTLKIMNHSDAAATYRIGFAGPAGARLRGVGVALVGGDLQVRVDPDGQAAMQVFVTAPDDPSRPRSAPAAVKVASAAGAAETKTVFLSGDQGQ